MIGNAQPVMSGLVPAIHVLFFGKEPGASDADKFTHVCASLTAMPA
jgi:hypothetical protein